jgi:rhodanese-related sulfurtransferase
VENLGEFIVNHWILCTAFVVLSWLVFSDSINRRLSGFKSVSANEAVRMVNQLKGCFVDVRETSEFNQEHIAEAVNIPLTNLKNDVTGPLKDKSQPLVVVCASGQRARNAAKALLKEGYEQVFVLSGGLHAWREAKLPLFSKQ